MVVGVLTFGVGAIVGLALTAAAGIAAGASTAVATAIFANEYGKATAALERLGNRFDEISWGQLIRLKDEIKNLKKAVNCFNKTVADLNFANNQSSSVLVCNCIERLAKRGKECHHALLKHSKSLEKAKDEIYKKFWDCMYI